MAATEWWCWPLSAWLGSGATWFVLLNIVVGAIFAMSSRAQPQSLSLRRGITRRASSALLQRLCSFSIFTSHPPRASTEAASDSPTVFRGADDAGTITARTRSPTTPAFTNSIGSDRVSYYLAPERRLSRHSHASVHLAVVACLQRPEPASTVSAHRHAPPPSSPVAASQGRP